MRHTQLIVNAAPTSGEGARTAGMISALVSAGIEGRLPGQPAAGEGALAGRRLRRPAPGWAWPANSALWVDPAEVPGHGDVTRLGEALAPPGGTGTATS